MLKSNTAMWWVLVLTGHLMMAVALYYQYVLGDDPCVICIHVRLWVAGMICAGIIGLIVNRSAILQVPAWLIMLGISGGFAEKVWETLSVDKGWTFGSCSVDAGLPDWFALDAWLPSVFEPRGACGQTPELLFGVSMAEGLMAVAVVVVVVSLVGVGKSIVTIAGR